MLHHHLLTWILLLSVAVKIYDLCPKIIVTNVINCDLCDYQTETTHSNSKALCSEAIIYELWFKSDTKNTGTKCYVILLLSTATKHYFHRQTCATCHAIFALRQYNSITATLWHTEISLKIHEWNNLILWWCF